MANPVWPIDPHSRRRARGRGSREARRLRRGGFVPGVLYGGGNGDAVSFKVNARELRHTLADGSALMDVTVAGGKARPVIVKDQQFHPVRDELLHIDLLEVRLDEKIQSTVAVELTGVEDSPEPRRAVCSST